jgi:hypothetical protein
MKIKSNGNGNGNGFPAEASPAGARGFFLVGPALAGKASGAAPQNDWCTHMIVPTLRVGMHPSTLRVRVLRID